MSKFKKLAILTSILFLQPMLNPGSFALAKRRKSPPKAFSFWAEGGKASQEECDGERKVPRKLKHIKEFAKAGYLGSEPQTFEIKDKDDKEMFKHFFNSKSGCNSVLAKTPSYAKKPLIETKRELPPDEGGETDDDETPQAQREEDSVETPLPVVNSNPSPSPSPSTSPILGPSVTPNPSPSSSPSPNPSPK